jgi:cell division protein DivIC
LTIKMNKPLLKKIFHLFVNKYVITLVAFAVWMIFFDSNNLLVRKKYQEKLQELRQEKEYYKSEIRKDSTLTQKLLTDSLALEKYARETYLMRKDKEDVYIVRDTSSEK